jgi:hypothetical protein
MDADSSLTRGRDWRESADPLNPCSGRAQRIRFYSETGREVKFLVKIKTPRDGRTTDGGASHLRR